MQPAWPTRQCVVLSREAQALSDNCWISPGSQLRSATTGCTAPAGCITQELVPSSGNGNNYGPGLV